MYDEERARTLKARIGFRFADDAFVATAGEEELDVKRGDPDGADAIFTGQPEALAAAVYGKLPLEELAGALKVEGDLAAAMRFISIFELPPKVEQPG
jgi:hypothetical protein